MVTSDAGFSVRIVDRHALEYSDTGRKLRLEIEIGLGSLSIYGSTLQAADGSGRLLVQESERMTILWRIVEAAKALGWNCTLDLSPESSDDV